MEFQQTRLGSKKLILHIKMEKQKVIIEISDGNETKQFNTYQSAAEYFKIPSTFTIFYALKHNKPPFKRRADKKVFYVKAFQKNNFVN